MLLFDAHLDLSMNAMDWNRDLRLPAEDLRQGEAGMSDLPGRGNGTVTLPDMRRGEIGLCVATLLAPTARPENTTPGRNSPHQSWAHIRGQATWYEAMAREGEMRQIIDCESLDAHLKAWENGDRRIGYVLSLEGADPLVTVDYLEDAVGYGLRALGPAHFGPGRFANGTNASGGLSEVGRALVKRMDELGVILDVSHLCDEAFWDALEIYSRPVWASHTNSRTLVPHNRQFSDQQYRALIDRDATIGVVADCWMLKSGWKRYESSPAEEGITLEAVADHVDHICQIAGNCWHVGIGSDLDGGFGREQSPADLDTIADLQRVLEILRGRGYEEADLEAIAHGNFMRVLRAAWG